MYLNYTFQYILDRYGCCGNTEKSELITLKPKCIMYRQTLSIYILLHLYIVDDGQGNTHRTKYRGIVHATVNITKEEGLLALYRVTFASVPVHTLCIYCTGIFDKIFSLQLSSITEPINCTIQVVT